MPSIGKRLKMKKNGKKRPMESKPTGKNGGPSGASELSQGGGNSLAGREIKRTLWTGLGTIAGARD